MKPTEFNHLIQTLGWVLLHSLWQGLIVYGLFLIFRRAFQSSSSTLKYFLGVASLAMILTSSVATFFLLIEPTLLSEGANNTLLNFQLRPALLLPLREISLSELTTTSLRWINIHLREFVMVWMAGTLFFGGRLLLAGWYAIRLQKSAVAINGIWELRLREFSSSMGIRRSISLAQSHFVDSPILVGYLKPLILLPIGILSGLTVQQVEAVLLHELAHIKRCDVAVNFTQSIMEVIFFFNPFVWAISSQIRIGREMCCDDMVVKWISPSEYAQALYKLEEVRWPAASLALAAVGNKNQLLQRIKRIMEPVKTKKEVGGKIVPALMIIVLVLVSGLLVRAHRPEHTDDGMFSALSDTTRKDLEKVKIKPSAPDERISNPREVEAIEEAAPAEAEELVVPAFPNLSLDMPSWDVAPLEALAQLDNFGSDSLRAWNYSLELQDTLPNIEWRQDSQWRNFEKEFTEQFQNQFSDFYKKNQPAFEKMMKELEGKLERINGRLDQQWTEQTRNAEREMARAEIQLRESLPRQEKMMRFQERSAKNMEMAMAHRNEALARSMSKVDRLHGRLESSMKSFEKELTTELTKDGYMGKDDAIKNLNWEDDGSININGKKIKDADKPKYKRLHEKYFQERGRFRHDE